MKFCENPMCSAHIETRDEQLRMLLTNDNFKSKTIILKQKTFSYKSNDDNFEELKLCSCCENAVNMIDQIKEKINK